MLSRKSVDILNFTALLSGEIFLFLLSSSTAPRKGNLPQAGQPAIEVASLGENSQYMAGSDFYSSLIAAARNAVQIVP
jgi:hypothetical protein